jgi:large subunit ribosomal protein L31
MPKKDIHPKYFENAEFICTTCGNKFVSGTTKGEEVRVDICSNCHPFFTGTQKFSGSQGRVEQFNAKFAKKDQKVKQAQEDSAAKKAENKKHAK